MSDDFRSVIQSAQQFEFTNVFADNKGGNLVAPKTQPEQVADQLKVIYNSRVFVVWRPYELCPRCSADFNAGNVTHNLEEDYTCPHTGNEEYEHTIDICLSGKGLLQKQEFFNQQDGTRCVHVMWLIADPKFVAEAIKKKEEAKKDKVYPPNPTKVFQEEYDKQKEAEPVKDTDPAVDRSEQGKD
jgi:hypothetical protein